MINLHQSWEQILIFIDQGGNVIWGIFLVCLLLWSLIIERYCFIKLVYPRHLKNFLLEWSERAEKNSWRAHKIREAMISEANSQLRTFVSTIKTLIAICPLLGLLGTVTGMVSVFDVIAITGTSDAQAMASGIFRATIPTMAGLIIALSGLYFNARIAHLVELETSKLADRLTPDNSSQPVKTAEATP